MSPYGLTNPQWVNHVIYKYIWPYMMCISQHIMELTSRSPSLHLMRSAIRSCSRCLMVILLDEGLSFLGLEAAAAVLGLRGICNLIKCTGAHKIIMSLKMDKMIISVVIMAMKSLSKYKGHDQCGSSNDNMNKWRCHNCGQQSMYASYEIINENKNACNINYEIINEYKNACNINWWLWQIKVSLNSLHALEFN